VTPAERDDREAKRLDLAASIERQFSDPSLPERWTDFDEADWRLIIEVLRDHDNLSKRLNAYRAAWRAGDQ
jgi:hypothetical protein